MKYPRVFVYGGLSIWAVGLFVYTDNQPEPQVSTIETPISEVKEPVEKVVKKEPVVEKPTIKEVSNEAEPVNTTPDPITEQPENNLSDLTISYIENNSFTDSCTGRYGRAFNYSIPKDEWKAFIIEKIESNSTGVYINSVTNTKVCVYSGTKSELLN